jgi:hypothetical protein
MKTALTVVWIVVPVMVIYSQVLTEAFAGKAHRIQKLVSRTLK